MGVDPLIPGKDLIGGDPGKQFADPGAAGQAMRSVERFIRDRSNGIAMLQGTGHAVGVGFGTAIPIANYATRQPKQSQSLSDLVGGALIIYEGGLWSISFGCEIHQTVGAAGPYPQVQVTFISPNGTLIPNLQWPSNLNYIASMYTRLQGIFPGASTGFFNYTFLFDFKQPQPANPIKIQAEVLTWNDASGTIDVTADIVAYKIGGPVILQSVVG